MPSTASRTVNTQGPAAERPPNILFFISEHHRWDWLGAWGRQPVRTPQLDRLAAEGMLLGECRCNSPMCAPSRAALATGRRFDRSGVKDNRADLNPGLPTFMRVLRGAGYRVGLAGKSDLHKKSQLHGIDGWSQRHGQLGFTDTVDMAGKRDTPIRTGREAPHEPYMAWLHANGLAQTVSDDLARRQGDMKPVETGLGIATEPLPLPKRYHNDDYCGERACGLLRSFPRDAPWFLQVSWGSAHPPFDAAEELVARYRDVAFPPPVDATDTVTDHQAVRRQYAAMLEGMDEWIGRVLAELDRRGERDNTVVVFSADHGEMLGDHGEWNKGQPNDPSVHVPLIVSGPGIQRGVRSNALVELIDLAATFTELAGAEGPPPDWDSRSLAPLLRGQTDRHREYTTAGFNDWRQIYDGRYKYVEEPLGRPSRLYDLREDPDECRNLLASQPTLAARLAQALVAELESPGKPEKNLAPGPLGRKN